MNPVKPTNRINLNDPAANMFGIMPCPECGCTRRWLTQPIHPLHPNCILCDSCGLCEPLADEDDTTLTPLVSPMRDEDGCGPEGGMS